MILGLFRSVRLCRISCGINTFVRFISTMTHPKNEMAVVGVDKSLDLSFVAAFRDPEFIFINNLFRKSGFEIRVAGGAVRDILMKKEPKDIDLATTATPAQMLGMFNIEQLRILNRNGEAHGTVTARINDKVNRQPSYHFSNVPLLQFNTLFLDQL